MRKQQQQHHAVSGTEKESGNSETHNLCAENLSIQKEYSEWGCMDYATAVARKNI